jgi:hypothetical protein
MVTWDIQRDGRAWGDEATSRYQMTPEKTEMVGGKLYGTEEERLTMLALLLENVGADKTVRLGNSSIWRGAVAALNEVHEDPEAEAPVSLLPEAERHALEARRGVLSRAVLSRDGGPLCEAGDPSATVAERLRRPALSVSTPVTSTSRRWWVHHDSASILIIDFLERGWL